MVDVFEHLSVFFFLIFQKEFICINFDSSSIATLCAKEHNYAVLV